MTRFNRNVLALAVGIILRGSATYASATGGEYEAAKHGFKHWVKPVKPPVVVTPPNVPPVVTPPVVTPPPVAVTPPVATTPPAQPAQQPSGPVGKWGDPVGPFVFAGVAIYFGAAIYSHWIFCAQREEKWHKDNKVARCYNAERDGLPK